MSNQINFLSQAPKKAMNKDQVEIIKGFIRQLSDFGVWDISALYKQYLIWISKTQNAKASTNFKSFRDVVRGNMFASQVSYKITFYRKRPMRVSDLLPYYPEAMVA
jgi:hypothetical protein